MGKVLDRLSALALRYWAFLVASFVFSFIFKVTVAGWLGPAHNGAFVIGLGLCSFIAFASQLGYPFALTRFIAEHKEREDREAVSETLSGCLALVIVTGGIAGVGLFIASDHVATTVYSDPELASTIAMFALVIPLFALFDTTFYALRGFQRQDQEGMVRALSTLVQLVIAMALLSMGMGLRGVIAAVIASFVVSSVAGLFLVSRNTGGVRPVMPSSDSIKRLSTFAIPLGISNMFATVSELVDTAIITRIAGKAVVGAYQACFPFTISLANLSFFIAPLIMPLAAGLSSGGDERRLKRLFGALVRYPWFAFLPVSLLVAGIADPLVTHLYAQRYGPYLPEMARLTAVLAFAVLFQMLTLLFFQMAGGLGRSRDVLRINLAYLSLLVGLDLVLVPELSATGAAIARLVAAGGAVALYLRLLGREVGRPSFAGIPTSCILALVAFAAMRSVPVTSPVPAIAARAAVGLLVYLPAFLYLCVTEDDRTVVREFIGSLSGKGVTAHEDAET